MVAILDYDAGNIKSVEKAFKFLGADVVTTRDEKEILRADHVVLPGVGAFGDAMGKLNEYGLVDVIMLWFACASIDWPACARMLLLLKRTISDAISVSRMRLSALVVFSTTLFRLAIVCSSLFWIAPRAERCVETFCRATLM